MKKILCLFLLICNLNAFSDELYVDVSQLEEFDSQKDQTLNAGDEKIMFENLNNAKNDSLQEIEEMKRIYEEEKK